MKSIALFIVGVKHEMAKVRWPSKKEMFKYSTATISFILLFAVFFMGTDILLGAIVRALS